MRIIAGKYKGKKLDSVKGDATRPTLDRVRENLFNILSARVVGARFLDLFAGTGAIGIEALSRGARDVVFCDQSKDAVRVINANLRVVGERQRVICADYKECLRALRGEKFDIIYLDPPYEFDPDLGRIAELLSDDGRIVFEHAAGREIKLNGAALSVVDERKYGIARLTTLTRPRTRAMVTGSFDPVTLGHVDLVQRALKKYDEVCVGMLINPDKTYRYSVEQRLIMLHDTFDEMGVDVHYSEGLAVDLAKKVGADVMVRGIRKGDEAYESELARLNEEIGGVKTDFFLADERWNDVSSSVVRSKLDAHEDVSELVPNCIIKRL